MPPMSPPQNTAYGALPSVRRPWHRHKIVRRGTFAADLGERLITCIAT